MSTREIVVRATDAQWIAWSEICAEKPIETWLAEVADDAAAEVGEAKIVQWPVAVHLRRPIEMGSQRITTIEVRRGRLGDLKGIKLGGGEMSADQLLLVASRMCGQPMKVVESLDPDDAGEVMPLVLDFFATCLRGGKRRSPP